MRAAFRCPYLLLSGTMEESSLERILTVLELSRGEVAVLFKSSDRPNIFTQIRPFQDAVNIMYNINICKYTYYHTRNMKEMIGFLIPVFCDRNFKKAQIFTTTRFLCDITGL